MAAKIVIGLTGNIATGKSLVLRMLQELGATVIDADKLVHQLMKQGSPVYQAIVEEFGKFVLDENDLAIYINGEFDNSVPRGGLLNFDNVDNLDIGAIDGPSYSFNGTIDEVKIYNKALV